MKLLDIGEVSRASGVPPSTLRFYEERGLIAPVARHGLRRQYTPGVVLQLTLIGMGKSAGFSLSEIAGMFGPDGHPELPRDELHHRADDIDHQIRELAALSRALRHVADCPAPSHLECPSFQRLMRISTRRLGERNRKSGGRTTPA
ncbi:helix-turn-helix domain-containing protein [Paracoccus aerodenitrificans]|uniref:helix-turn-helix domain-containing protein n=1 Tax=Paracoccus aerodenitrificans TaxID=3017781 RepID=UPI0022F09655|nr:helix-turn-helix domain-containing protein [Paracoccus aerodenitrificans]WBU65103.1 helix-turn-helix domain-containing protein [Paracoccus aerodenitrificans]